MTFPHLGFAKYLATQDFVNLLSEPFPSVQSNIHLSL